ncbi:uncharacterized protein A1O9_08361, partial [Exophiala aquamarina CBS 119918]
LQSLHTTGYLHRDIKPENFLRGTGKQGNIVYMTDLGLAAYEGDSYDQATSHKPAGPSPPPGSHWLARAGMPALTAI